MGPYVYLAGVTKQSSKSSRKSRWKDNAQMKNQPSMMIRCIVLDREDIENELLVELSKIIMRHWQNAYLTLNHAENYWKTEGEKDIKYGLAHSPPINVHNFIKLFPLTWHNRAGSVHEVTSHTTYFKENSIWSKLNHPDEMFLLPNVEWVHIYTWPDGFNIPPTKSCTCGF